MDKPISKDEVAVRKMSREVESLAVKLLHDHGEINWYSDISARGSALRILRAAIELVPADGEI